MWGNDHVRLAAPCRYEALLALSPEAYVADLEAKGEDLTIQEVRVRMAVWPETALQTGPDCSQAA